MDMEQFRQTNNLATKPHASVSITIFDLIGDTSRFNMFTQSCDMNECVAPIDDKI